jgi:hypothetical protein
VVPRRTMQGAARQHGAVGVQHGRITHVGQCGQHRALRRGGIGQQLQRVSGMHRDHHAAEAPDPIGGVTYLHPVRRPAHRAHRRTATDLGQRRGDTFDVDRGSAGDRTPAGSVAAHEQAVIVEERQQRADRVAAGRRHVTGPDDGDQRQDDVIGEVRRQAVVGQHRRQGQVWRHRGRQQRAGRAVELGRLFEQVHARQLPGFSQPPGQCPQPAARRVLQPAAVAGHAERHVRALRLDGLLAKQAHEIRVIRRVVHQEPGVQRQLTASVRQLDPVRVGVPAKPGIGLVQGHAAYLLEEVGSGQPGYAGPDDRDLVPRSPAGHGSEPDPRARTTKSMTRPWDQRGAK